MISVFCLRKTTNWKSVNQPLFSGRSWVVKEIAPSLGHAALLGNPATTPFDHFLKAAEGLARWRLKLCHAGLRTQWIASTVRLAQHRAQPPASQWS
jgi:hypothetical protein